MAWPCITRACCINRFWTELDKADIAVPLVFTKYSDVAEVQRLPAPPHHHHHHHQRAAGVAIETQQPPPGGERPLEEAPPAAAAADTRSSAASVMRQDFRAWRVRPEPSCRPRDEYQPSTGPFNNQTQYQKDYKAWPIPKKHDHPWIHRPEREGGVEKSQVEEKLQEKKKKVEVKLQEEKKVEVKLQEEKKVEVKLQESKLQEEKMVEMKVKEEKTVDMKVEEEKVHDMKIQEEKVEEVKESKVETGRSLRREKSAEKKKQEEQRRDRAAADAVNRQIQEVTTSSSSSYRTEFKAYKNVKPVKAIKAAAQYKPPVEETSLETSYSATYRGEQVKAPPTDNKLQERRRIRSLYSEPSGKEPKVDKPVSRTKPKKSSVSSSAVKMVKKVKKGKEVKETKEVKEAKEVKEKTVLGSQSKKKTSVVDVDVQPEVVVTKKSKEISNRLAEAKH